MIRALSLALVTAALLPASAAADVTTTAITTPAQPTYRLFEASVKASEPLRITGTTDGRPGDLLDIVCTRGDSGFERAVANVPVDKDGSFSAMMPLDTVKPAACILRAVPYKYAGKDYGAFTGPLLAVTYFNPATRSTAVRGETTVALDYEVETGHRRGHATVTAGAGLKAHFGVRPTLERNPTRTWEEAARIEAVVVDGATAYVGPTIPRVDVEGRLYAPRGFDGVQMKVEVDPATGAVTIVETARVLRCDESCAAVIDTGVRLERTVTLGNEHAHADVRDRWVSADGAAHTVRVEYSHGAAADRWRFPGSPVFRTPAPGERFVADKLLVHDGTANQAIGAVTFDPAPSELVFVTPKRVSENMTAGTVRRLFTVGENVIEDEPDAGAGPRSGAGPGRPGGSQRPAAGPPGRLSVRGAEGANGGDGACRTRGDQAGELHRRQDHQGPLGQGQEGPRDHALPQGRDAACPGARRWASRSAAGGAERRAPGALRRLR